MTPSLARRLVALYPASWRARYGAEFAAFLEDGPSAVGTVLNVIGWAVVEHIRGTWRPVLDDRQRSVILMAYASLCSLAAGVNFYWSVDDTPLAPLMKRQWGLFGSFHLVTAGSLLALFAVAAMACRVLVAVVGSVRGRRPILTRLAAPVLIGVVTVVWLLAAAAWSQQRWGHAWVPTPWDVGGDWAAPAGWPPTGTRVMLGALSFILLVAGLLISGASVAGAVRRSDLSRVSPAWFRSASSTLAAAIILMSVGVIAWGWAAQGLAPIAFRARDGGLFYLTNASSCALSAALFLASVALSVRGRDAATRLT